MKKQLVLVVLALCLALLGSTHPSLAQEDDSLAVLQREGWKIVKDGVLQRELRAGEVETFVFGVPGFTWKLQDLGRQLQKLQAEFRAHPTPELRKAIANHRKAVASARKALAIARTAEELGEATPSKVSCAINFSYDATAAGKTDVQGVVASSSATFSANCGFTGQVYAYAFAKAIVNGAETTQTVTDGPRSGANVSATAFASRSGGTPCESYAYGEMVSYGLSPSSYSQTSQNYSCGVPQTPAPVPTINGTSYASVSTCTTYTWTSSVSGGAAPFTYQWTWNGAAVGTGSSYSRAICPGINYNYSNNTLALSVIDSASRTGSASKSVVVEKMGSGGGGGCGAPQGQICP
jgi:hypothetical protein